MRSRLGPAAVALALAAAGLAAQDEAKAPVAPGARTLAVTVDDLPAVPASDIAEMRRITDGVLAALRRHRVTAVGFVNEGKLANTASRAERMALLRAWRDAGHDLGNHTYSHPDLNTTPLADYERDVLRGEPALRELLPGRERRFFRHPMTHTGPSAEVRRGFESFLAEHGYAVAPFSVENADYVFDLALRDARRRGDGEAAERLLSAYVDHALGAVAFCEGLATDTFGREVPQILLVHANATNAERLDTLLSRLAARGYRFVSLEQALADPDWSTPDEYVGPKGLSWLHRFRVARGLPLRPELEPDPPAWVLEAFRAAQARQR